MIPKIKIDDFHPLQNSYIVDGKCYEFQKLIEAAKDLPVFDLPLVAVNLYHKITTGTVYSYLYHQKRIEAADLSYPIILDDMGCICDGWHRVAKAILLGHETIKAKRLNVMPEYELLK